MRIQEYASYSKKIVAAFSIEEPTPQQKYYLSRLLIQRARIGKNAAQKYTKFRELIPTFYENGVFDHCLVYCSDGKDPEDGTTRCIESVVSMLNEADVTCRAIRKPHLFAENAPNPMNRMIWLGSGW